MSAATTEKRTQFVWILGCAKGGKLKFVVLKPRQSIDAR
jgi:hypothetical protein